MVPEHEFASLDNHVQVFGEKAVALLSGVEFQVYILKHEPTAFSRNVGKSLPSDTASYPGSTELQLHTPAEIYLKNVFFQSLKTEINFYCSWR